MVKRGWAILVGICIWGSSVHADDRLLVVEPFSGKLSMAVSGVKITGMQVEVKNQLCNLWGSSCGGPVESKELGLSSEFQDGANYYYFSLGSKAQVEISNPPNRFSSCKVDLRIHGVDEGGNKLNDGWFSLVWETDLRICKSPQQINELITQELSSALVVTLVGSEIKVTH